MKILAKNKATEKEGAENGKEKAKMSPKKEKSWFPISLKASREEDCKAVW